VGDCEDVKSHLSYGNGQHHKSVLLNKRL